jgi:hypothetical protein
VVTVVGLVVLITLPEEGQEPLPMPMDQRTPSDLERLQLRRHIERIRRLCSAVLEGYSSHCQEWYGHPVRQRNLDKIQLLYEQRIERRCASR